MKIRPFAALALLVLAASASQLRAQATTPTPDPLRDIVYAADDPALQTLDVTLPVGADRPAPTVLLIHGGGFRVGDKREMQPIADYFALSGFAVVNINYRLTPDVAFPAPLADSACALAWLHAHAADYGFDPKRVVAVGESAGGYLVAMLGVMDPPPLDGCPYTLPDAPLQAVIPYYPMTGLALDDYSSFARPFFALFLGSAPDDADYGERYRVASPLTYIDGSEPPFLILNGTRDPVLPPGDASRLAAALEGAGVPVRLELFEAGEHAFIARLRTDAGKQAAQAARDFIASLTLPR